MNILLFSTHLNIGGITSYVVNAAKQLKQRGHNVIVASGGGNMAGELAKNGIVHVGLNVKTKSELSPKLLFALPVVLSIIKQNDIHIIHAHTRVTQVLSSLISCFTGIPYVTTCHGFYRLRLGRRLFNCWGGGVIAISDAVKRHLIEDFNIDKKRVALIYNGVEIERFRQGLDEDKRALLKKRLNLKEKIVIGTIGRLSSVKGYEYLITAFRYLLNIEKFPLHLLIVGDGPQKKQLESLSKELGIENSVTFAYPTPDTPGLLAIMDIFVSSSVKEGLGLSLIEALAARRPVVATDTGGVSSVVRDNDTGILVRPEDSRALAEGISLLLNNPSLRKRLALNGGRFAEERFTVEKMVEKTEAFYKEILDKGSSRRSRLLIVNVNWIGDLLFTTAFLRAVRRAYPKSYIASMVAPRCKGLLEDNPNTDEVIIYDEDGTHKGIFGKLKMIRELRKKRFDTSFILHRSFTRALMIFLAGVKRRIGYNTKRRGFLLTAPIEEDVLDIHKVEYFLNIARRCGIKTESVDCEFFVNEAEREAVGAFFKENKIEKNEKVVILNPGGNWPPKRWPAENFARLSDRISDELKARVIITGADKDRRLAGDILELAHNGAINVCGDTSLKRLGALMERADIVVSSDSGPMHLALSVKSKVIALFGPTSDAITGPYGSGSYTVIKKDTGCRVPCYNFGCRDYRCMKAITVGDVFEKVKEMLSG